MKKCWKCDDGYIEKYKHVSNGICFECGGDGYIFETDEEIEKYENATKKEKEEYIEEQEKEREIIEELESMVAIDNGFDSYQEFLEHEERGYEEMMQEMMEDYF